MCLCGVCVCVCVCGVGLCVVCVCGCVCVCGVCVCVCVRESVGRMAVYECEETAGNASRSAETRRELEVEKLSRERKGKRKTDRKKVGGTGSEITDSLSLERYD